MWLDQEGERPPPERKRDRPILSLKRDGLAPSICSDLAVPEQVDPTANHTPLQRFEMALWAERNSWDINRRGLPEDAEAWLRGGAFAGRGRLSKTQAGQLLERAFAALEGSNND